MRVSVVGGGGREAAIARRLYGEATHDAPLDVLIGPGNGLTQFASKGPVVNFDDMHSPKVKAYLQALVEHDVSLVVSGSESQLVTPISLGAIVRGAGIPFLGASPRAAALEGSKILTRRLLESAGVPQPKYRSFHAGDFSTNREKALEYGSEQFFPQDELAGVAGLVVKADGLCGGKGVKVCRSFDEYKEGIDRLEPFEDSGANFLVEEMLEGAEVSCTVVVGANGSYQLLSFAQDYKLSGDGDTGDNTGGMGAVTIDLPKNVVDYIKAKIIEPSIAAAEEDGRSMKGAVAYFGLMLTKDGPKVLEINMRMGDPETQVILPRYDGHIHKLFYNAATGQDVTESGSLRPEHFAAVCLASKGYPKNKAMVEECKQFPITGISDAEMVEGVHLIGGGVRFDGQKYFPDGTRVLYVVGRGGNQVAALERVYTAVDLIKCEGLFNRGDIGCNLEKIREIVARYDL